MKKSITIKDLIDTSIEAKDLVKIKDGSAFSVDGFENLYIVLAYKDIFKTNIKVKDLIFEVVQTNVTDTAIFGVNSYYRQDLILRLTNSDENIIVRSASQLVYKIGG